MARRDKPSILKRAGVLLGRALLPVLGFLLGDLSPRAARFWSRFIWVVTWPFLFRSRRIVKANLEIAFPGKSPEERRRIARAAFIHLFGLGLDWLHFLKYPNDSQTRIRNSEEFRRLHTEPNPESKYPSIIYCTPHLGNWELEAHISFLTGRPGSVVAAVFNVDWFNELAERLRTNDSDTQVIPAHGAARGVLRALVSGRNVGLLIDQNIPPRKGGVFEDFFGLPATTSRMPAMIARRLKVPIHIVACVKDEGDGLFTMVDEPLPGNAWEFASDEELTAEIMAAYERLISRYPEQYLWQYTRWRYIPEGVSPETAAKYPFYAKRKGKPTEERDDNGLPRQS